jgi:hypothetical protein
MKNSFYCLLILFLIVLVQCGCKKHSAVRDRKIGSSQLERVKTVNSGAAFISQLARSSELPGVSQQNYTLILSTDNTKKNSAGIWSLTCALTIVNDPDKYNYAITQTSSNGAWQLQRAWKTDVSGKTIEEFSIK